MATHLQGYLEHSGGCSSSLCVACEEAKTCMQGTGMMPHVRQCQLCMSMRQQSQIMSTTLNTFRPEGYIDQQKQHLTVIQMGKQLVLSDVIRCCWQGIRSVWDQYLIGQCIIGTASKTRDKVICCLCVYSKQMTTILAAGTAISKFMYVSF